MLVDESVDLDPDCRLKVAVGFSRSGPDFVHANTTVPTIITVVDVSTTHH